MFSNLVVNVSFRFSWNSEAGASEFQENRSETFAVYGLCMDFVRWVDLLESLVCISGA